jgi:hypothetical protein
MVVTTGIAGAGSSEASPAPACSYRPSALPGLPGGNGAGQLTETDGGQRFTGWAYRGTDSDPYPHGAIWHNGSVVADFGALNQVDAVNRSGDAVGSAAGATTTVFVPHGGRPIQLAVPAKARKTIPSPSGISDDGWISGVTRFDDGTFHALAWHASTAGTAVRDLGPVGHWDSLKEDWGLAVQEISDTGGQIVGGFKFGSRKRAVVGTVNGFAPLGGVDPNADSTASDIAGRYILGTGTIPGAGQGSVLWDNGAPRLLPVSGFTHDVNSSGVVVGHQTTNGHDQAFVLTNGVRTTLPALPGHTDARALAVTEDGRIAGWSRSSADPSYSTAVVWSCN